SLCISRWVRRGERVVLVVSISGACVVTSTVWLEPATAILKFRVGWSPTLSLRPLLPAWAKPLASTFTSYVPGGRLGITKLPVLVVFTERGTPVATFVAVTVAPVTTAP